MASGRLVPLFFKPHEYPSSSVLPHQPEFIAEMLARAPTRTPSTRTCTTAARSTSSSRRSNTPVFLVSYSNRSAPSGLPPAHPLVIYQGFGPKMVDAYLRADAAKIIKAGYNLRCKKSVSHDQDYELTSVVSLVGSEVGAKALGDSLEDISWHGAGVGNGERSATWMSSSFGLRARIPVFRGTNKSKLMNGRYPSSLP
jgi:hypothetical protein